MKEENKLKLIELLKGMSLEEMKETILIIEMIKITFRIFDIKE